jgi:cytoskeletal protein RodZ
MSIRLLAFALLAGVCVAHAAPPKSKEPKHDAASAQQTPESIDVDALARSKDAGGSTPADADAPPSDAPPESPPPAEIPAETPASADMATGATPAEAAASEVPSTEAAAPAEPLPSHPAEPATSTARPPSTAAEAAAAAKAASSPAATKGAETSERISIAAGCQARATSLLDSAEKSDFAGATTAFDAKMRTALPPPKLKDAWDQLSQFGKLVARGQSHLGSGDGYTIVMIPLIFEKANLVAQIACGTDGRIAGFYVKPAPTSPAEPAPGP